MERVGANTERLNELHVYRFRENHSRQHGLPDGLAGKKSTYSPNSCTT